MIKKLEKTLPRESYLEEKNFEKEWRAIFQSGWVCVGHASRLKVPGDYLAVKIHDQSILIVLGHNGIISAFFNVCRHRGTELVPMEVRQPIKGHFKNTITCPYHAWSYSLNGQLRKTPHLNIDARDTALYKLPLEKWGGFIFIQLKGHDAENLCNSLGPGVERLANYPLTDLQVWKTITYEIKANWKVILENYNECYHCAPLHPELCQIVPAFRQGGGGHLDWNEGVPHREGASTFTATGKTKRAPFPGLSAIEKTHHKGELFYPNLMLSLSMDHVAAFYLWPINANLTLIETNFLFHPTETGKRDFDGSDAVQFWDMVNQQDWKICESVQRGMQNMVFKHGYYAPMEDHSLDIRNYVRRKLMQKNP